MGGFPNNLSSVLYGKRSGIMKANPRTPGTLPGKLYQPPTDPGNQFDTSTEGDDTGYTADVDRLRQLVARPPQEGMKPDGTKIGGLRRVLGTVASTVGPLIGGPAVAGLGEKLLYPGRDKYNADLSRAQALVQMSGAMEDRKDREANRADMRFNRNTVTNARQDALDEKKRNDAQAQINNITGPGKGWEIPDAPTLPETRLALKPQMPMAVGQPAPPSQIATQNVHGPSPVEQVDDVTGKPLSEVGTVNEVQVPGQGKKRFVRPNANTLRGFDVKKKADELEATRTEEITPAMLDAATALKMTGLPAAGKVTPTVYNNFMTGLREQERQNGKPVTPTAEGEKIKYQNIAGKLSAEGLISGAAITDSRQMLAAIQKSKSLTPEEKNAASAYLASNSNPAGQGANATIRVEGMGENSLRSVIDTQNGNALRLVNVNDINRAEPGRYVEAGSGQKVLNKAALLEDIRGSIGGVRNSLAAIPEFSAADKILVATAMRDRDPRSAISQLIGGAAGNHMSPEQQDYLISLAQLHEQAMAMRGVLGAGQSSEDLRAAIMRTIPGPSTPNKAYAAKQLDAFEQTLNRLSRGVATVPLRDEKPVGATNPNAPKVGGMLNGVRIKSVTEISK